MAIETVKGFRDFIGEDALKREKIREILVRNFKNYGFGPSETPVIEYEEFVKGENPTDEAVSDIFKLQDRGRRNLALRYEFTFQLKRLAENKKLPFKRYQIGPVFRDEPISANRFRQITQCDIDIVGSTIKEEAEVLALASNVLKELGIKFVININNRKLLNEILESQGVKGGSKEAVIREIDKLDKLPEKNVRDNLKRYGAEKVIEIFKRPESYFKKFEAYAEIEELKKCCSLYKVKVNFLPSLARGLSYYNRSIFEVKTPGMKETIGGGGSYPLNNIQSTGISFGLDRLSQLAKVNLDEEKFLIISIGEDKKAIELAEKLRGKNKKCAVMFGKPSKALEYANSYKIPFVIFVGKEELKKKKFKLRDMKTGKEQLVDIKDII